MYFLISFYSLSTTTPLLLHPKKLAFLLFHLIVFKDFFCVFLEYSFLGMYK